MENANKSGLFYRRPDGKEVPFDGRVWIFEQQPNGEPLGLCRIDAGKIQEAYHVPTQGRAAVYLAAIAQGLEPPRGLKRQDKPFFESGGMQSPTTAARCDAVQAAKDFKYWLDIQPPGAVFHPGGGDARATDAYEKAENLLRAAEATLQRDQGSERPR
jgi:hypothetical protein